MIHRILALFNWTLTSWPHTFRVCLAMVCFTVILVCMVTLATPSHASKWQGWPRCDHHRVNCH